MASDARTIAFGEFTLDRAQHELRRGGDPVPLKPRYFDALALLVANAGELVSRERFFDEVWAGVIVGDEALTQAIKDLRKALGDDATSPRFIQTVPKRGYRFIGRIAGAPGAQVERATNGPRQRHAYAPIVLAGGIGGAGAGVLGGFVYGLIAGISSDSALAILLVMTTLTALLAGAAGLAVTLGMALASRLAGRRWLFSISGAALGGFLVGELFHRVASDSFSLFLGRPHDAFTGGLEGLILGAALAIGARLGGGDDGRWPRPVIGAAAAGALAGLAISYLGGRLMASSLAALARQFHGSQLELGMFGKLSADDGFASSIQALAAGMEGLLFGGAVVAAILLRLRKAH